MSTIKQWCSFNLTHSVLSQTLNKFGSKYHLISIKYFGFLDNDAVCVLIKYKFLMASRCNFITIDLFFYYLLECFTGALSEIRTYCKVKEITANQITWMSRVFRKVSCIEEGLHLGVRLEINLVLKAETEKDFHVMGGLVTQRKR